MQNLVSIIIPCYNQGHFINDALKSINENEINYPLEIIIVNDGSTDEGTIDTINELSLNKKYTIINQNNQGLAAARNNGIAIAKGAYILPLDADNKITSAYINQGVAALIKGMCDIIYCKPVFFGEDLANRKYNTIAFNIYDLLERNYIDACAIYRKEVWVKNDGYDGNMPIKGYEDWDFWIGAYDKGFSFKFLNEPLFYYRITGNSMIDNFAKEKFVQVHKYIMRKHTNVFLEHFVKLSYIRRKYDVDINRWPVATFIFLLYKLKVIKNPYQKAAKKLKHYCALM